ncbi:DUF7948 domain-containing protein [Hymenobacter negativus]|uniref:Gliding motility-associated C-terminal domain-containing protein n=1 Tax=Hymenobacter negativus TaxID=2795026 RepID=A0ABS0Q7Q4_9BACT|nr:gliding motility-associated C-terminal domain-containing protein [Hymenobacter negativus]MBH8558691.1 gliding motility-associated C-terminal domain-containing protein [Hymenobacter negativus]
MKLLLPLAATLLLSKPPIAAHAQPATPPAPANPTLEFIENKGQWDGHARYAAALPGGRLFAEADGLTFALINAPALAHHGAAAHPEPANAPAAPADSLIRGHAMTLRFVGAAPTAQLVPAEATADRRNYLLGANPKHWARDVRGYHRLRYVGLWPGVDAQVYESADQQLEYDFELAAGADPTAIVLRHDGADKVQLDAEGNLQLQTSVGRITERAPQAWQTDAAGQRRPVACRYRLAADGTVRFALGNYDRQQPLTIDPVVVFSTYTGSTADNWGFTATYDAQGNLYSGGIVFGVGYPASPGAFRTSFAGLIDIAIIKYNTAASGQGARVWATYLGGSSADFPTSMVVNSQGELLLLGITSSLDYPTTAGAIQRTFAGGTAADPYGSGSTGILPNGSDLVITRFNAAGAALVGSTYLGGSQNDGLLAFDRFPTVAQLVNNYGDSFRGDIALDATDNVYVASHTASPGFPVARGLAGGYHGGATDGLVLKLNPTLTALVWGSFLGGSAADAAYSLQVAPGSGEVYVAGGTTSTNFPTTAGSYQPAAPGYVDGFAARISANGLSLSRATYVGTAGYDQAHFLQLGSDGGVYLMGQTLGTFPRTPGAFSTTNGTLFVQKLASDLSSSLIATAFGSTDSRNANRISLSPTAFLVDQCDRVYVCGWGGGANQSSGVSYLGNNGSTFGLPITSGAIQPSTDGSDFYLAQFTAGLTGLAYGTYYGRNGSTGDHVDGGTARFDPRGVVYQAVCSCSGSGFPILGGVNTFSTINGSSNCNNAAFVLNFQPDIANAGTDQQVCATAGPQSLVGTPAGGVWTGPGVSGSVATGFVFTPSIALLGVQTLTYTVASTGTCTTVGTRRITVGSPPTVTFAPVGTGVFCRAVTDPVLSRVTLSGTPAGGTFSGPGVVNGAFDPMVAGAGTHTLTYTYFNGCTVAIAQQVRVAFVSAGAAQRVCTPGPAVALMGTPAGGTWAGPGVTGSPATGFVFTPTAGLAGANTLVYTATTMAPTTAASCTASSSVVFTVVPTPVISLTLLPALCTASLTRQRLVATPAGGYWSGPGVGFDGLGYYFQLPPGLVGTYALTYTAGDSPCTVSAVMSVVVAGVPVVAVAADTVLCPGSTAPFRLRGSPAGGTWTGPGVTGSPATGFQFAPAGLTGFATLTYSVANVGCTGTATRRISIAPVPDVVPSWAPEICAETRLAPLTVRFRLASTSSVTYTGVIWEFGDGTQSTDISPVHTYPTPGSYQPRLRTRYNQGRCETQTTLPTVEVKERKIPNIITPNGDNQNQTFRLGPDCPPRLHVFSRWGQKVFEAAAYRDDWNAEGQPDGVYYYLASYPDGHQLKGWVEVRR